MFGFPAHPKADNFRLTQNLLQTVTFHVKYRSSNLVSLLTSEVVSAVLPILPVVKQIQKAVATVVQSSSDANTPLISGEVKPDGLQFSLADNTKVFAITDEAMTLTFVGHVYTHFVEAQAEFNRLIESVLPILNIEAYTKLSIRKINVVNCQPAILGDDEEPWLGVMQDVFNPELIGHVLQSPASSKLTSSVVNSRFHSDNNYLTIIYGILPKQVEPGVRQAVLDIDLAFERDVVSLEEVRLNFAELNKEIFNIFMWSIVPELIEAIKS